MPISPTAASVFPLSRTPRDMASFRAWMDAIEAAANAGSGGDVVGPAGATANNLAAFDGATGKLIKQLTYAAVTALLDAVVGDSGAGGTKGLVPAPGAGDAAAGKFLKANGAWEAPAGGGDVVGPASAVNEQIAVFDGTTGKLIKDGGTTIAALSGSILAAVRDGVDAAFDTLAEIATALGGKVDKSTFNAHTILAATTDDTPAALTIGEQTVVGRLTGGNIKALSQAELTALGNDVVGDSGAGGTKGLVPAPAAGDAAAGKPLQMVAQGTRMP